MKGWKREPARHSLSSRGVRSSPSKSFRKPFKKFVSLSTYTGTFPYWTSSFIASTRSDRPDIAWDLLGEHGIPKTEQEVLKMGILVPTAVYRILFDGRNGYTVQVCYINETGAHVDNFTTQKLRTLEDAEHYAEAMRGWSSDVLFLHDRLESTVLGKGTLIDDEWVEGPQLVPPESAEFFLLSYDELKEGLKKVPPYIKPYLDRMQVGSLELAQEARL